MFSVSIEVIIQLLGLPKIQLIHSLKQGVEVQSGGPPLL